MSVPPSARRVPGAGFPVAAALTGSVEDLLCLLRFMTIVFSGPLSVP